MSKIERLAPEQQADLPAYRDDWFRVGICTDPADRPTAEAAISAMYRIIGHESPRFVWCDSPMTSHLAMHVFENGASLGASLWDSLRASLRVSLGDSLRDSLGDSLGDSLRDSLRDSLGISLGASLWDSLGVSLGVSLRASLGASLWDSLGASLRDSLRKSPVQYRSTYWLGQQDSYWIAFYSYARDVLKVAYDPESSRRLNLHASIARSCMWWWPFDGLCVISERPSAVHFDDAGRLHREDGPAVAFRDGWSIWRIGGVAVDEQIVLRPETQTLAQIRGESNLEVKRIRVERLGWPRYLDESKAVVLDRRRNDIEATREALMRTPDGETVLVAACPSTSKVFALEVPPATSTCEAAQHWLSAGLSGRIINAS